MATKTNHYPLIDMINLTGMKLSKQGWFIIAVIGITTCLMAIPMIVAIASSPADQAWTGRTDQNSGDYGIYFSQMEQARQGNFLFKNLYDSTPHRRIIFNPLWLLLGIISRLTGLSVPLIFHLARLVLIPIFILTLWNLIKYFFRDQLTQNVSLLVALFGGGIASYAATTDASVFNALLFSPHTVLSLTLLIIVFVSLLKSFDNHKKNAVIAGICGLCLFLIHPYHISTVYGVFGIYALIVLCQKKYAFTSVMYPLVIFSVISAPAIIYYYWLFHTGLPFGSSWLNQSDALMKVRTPWEMAWSYLPMVILAIFGLIIMKKNKNPDFAFLGTWMITPFVLMSIPAFFRMRMTGGVFIALAMAAAYASVWWWRSWLKQHRYVCVLLIQLIIALIIPITLQTLLKNIAIFKNPQPLVYLTPACQQSMEWYKHNAYPADVLLAGWRIGNLAPALTGRTVYAGHGIQTISAEKKYQDISAFFQTSTSDDDRLHFIKNNHITYVYYSPQEKSLGTFDPDQAPYLKLAYEKNEIKIYTVISK